MNTVEFRQYEKDRRSKKIEWAISFLGGKCVNCGSTEDLEFDHSEPELKTQNPGIVMRCSQKRIQEYLIAEKIQLLCNRCHGIKTWLESP